MSFNNRSALNICQLSFHICFQKQKLSPGQNFDEWVIVSPKLKICGVALMCSGKAEFRLRDTKWIPWETSLMGLWCAAGLTALFLSSYLNVSMLQEEMPGCSKIINSIHLGKNLIPVTIFEAVIGYMLDTITKGKRFKDRESILVKEVALATY